MSLFRYLCRYLRTASCKFVTTAGNRGTYRRALAATVRQCNEKGSGKCFEKSKESLCLPRPATTNTSPRWLQQKVSDCVAIVVQNAQVNADPQDPMSAAEQLSVALDDHVLAYESKTTKELWRALIVFFMCSMKSLVKHNKKIIRIMYKILGKKIFERVLRGTLYAHFVAGEDEERIKPVIKHMHGYGVKPILDYSAEEDLSQNEAEEREMATAPMKACYKYPHYQLNRKFADRRANVVCARTYFYKDEQTCDCHMDMLLRRLELVAGTSGEQAMATLKLSALGRPQQLMQLSELIVRTRKYMSHIFNGQGNVMSYGKTMLDIEHCYSGLADVKGVQAFLQNITYDAEGIVHLLPWSSLINGEVSLNDMFRVPDPKTGQMRRFMSKITTQDEQVFSNMIRRLNTIMNAAAQQNVRVMIDAEQSYFQLAISRIALEMMRKYNTEQPIVYNTYQAYLTNTYGELACDLEQAMRQDFYFGAKLVRGAYWQQERARAKDMHYPDPTCADVDASTANFHRTISTCLDHVQLTKECGDDPTRVSLMIATHNERTVRYTVSEMERRGIWKDEQVVAFGQLLGMCDNITFALAMVGYPVYKYVPYGPIDAVLPYLSRRMHENIQMMQQLQKQQSMTRREIWHRIIHRASKKSQHGREKKCAKPALRDQDGSANESVCN